MARSSHLRYGTTRVGFSAPLSYCLMTILGHQVTWATVYTAEELQGQQRDTKKRQETTPLSSLQRQKELAAAKEWSSNHNRNELIKMLCVTVYEVVNKPQGQSLGVLTKGQQSCRGPVFTIPALLLCRVPKHSDSIHVKLKRTENSALRFSSEFGAAHREFTMQL
ncbi:hypothetical protein NDU88_004200 [Pleurodeles waltl]|uniref:Uncharacterized protein n=1 Tax=Pleurodeles waltl TaxID=8319 RepID=A0AAV7KXN4_PLEWA|nr:hypothetical protein NDU88_004200 [Pleurodeles waltl]